MTWRSLLESVFYNVPTLSRWAAIYGRPSHDGDAMALWGRTMPFDDGGFAAAYDDTTKFTTTRLRLLDIRWRAYICCWAAKQALLTEGDFVECGVNTGILSGTVCRYLDFAKLDRKFWLFDTYEGIPVALALENEQIKVKQHNKHYFDVWDVANSNFAQFTNANLVKGRVPESLHTVSIGKVAYLSIDMNVAVPERAALDYFWQKVSPGGVIVLDDYGFVGHDEQRLTANEFAASVGVPILPLPTGQAIMVKTK
jgi:O-methyltransferase